MSATIKTLRETVAKLDDGKDAVQTLMVLAVIGVLEEFLHDHKRIADALEAIAINLEESNPDAPA